MEIASEQRALLEICAIRIDQESLDWSLIARQALDPAGLDALRQGMIARESERRQVAPGFAQGPRAQHRTGCPGRCSTGGRRPIRSPAGHCPRSGLSGQPAADTNLPPFLFYRGDLSEDDVRSVAVVGTRTASATGTQRAAKMSRLLADQDVTVVSGLARGMDTAAHRAALEAEGRPSRY